MSNHSNKLKINRNYVSSSIWNGKYYSNHSEWQFHVAKLALEFLTLPKNQPIKILDIGCGNGYFTRYLANQTPNGEILGLDPSVSMLEIAQKNIESNLSFICGNATHLPFKNQFDCIVAFNSLHWVAEIDVALEQIYSALVPGGKALFLVAPIQSRHPLHRIIDEVIQQRWQPHFDRDKSIFPFYTFSQWSCLIEESKLIPENIRIIDASMDYPNKNAFADSLKSWIPFGSIPEDKKMEFIDDIVASYLSRTPCEPNGTVHYNLDELVILASKPLT